MFGCRKNSGKTPSVVLRFEPATFTVDAGQNSCLSPCMEMFPKKSWGGSRQGAAVDYFRFSSATMRRIEKNTLGPRTWHFEETSAYSRSLPLKGVFTVAAGASHQTGFQFQRGPSVCKVEVHGSFPHSAWGLIVESRPTQQACRPPQKGVI